MKLPLLFFTFCFSLSFSQQTIKGKVTQKDGTPLEGATVMIADSYDGTITDSMGDYSFTTTEQGNKKLIYKFIGFKDKIFSIELQSKDITMNIVLKEISAQLDEVILSAGTFEAGDKKKAVALNSIDMISVPGSQGNVVGALQFLPGTSSNGESGKLFVRGGSSRENQGYIDGSLVPVPYNTSAPNTAVRSKFNPFMFQGTVFSAGGFSAEYGQALSSVLLLETNDLQKEDQLDFSILSVSVEAAGTKRWKKSALTGSISHSNLQPYMGLIKQNIDWIKAPIQTTADLNFRTKTKNGLLKFYTTSSDSDLHLNQQNINNNLELSNVRVSEKNWYSNGSWKTALAKDWFLKLSSSFNYNQNQLVQDAQMLKNRLKVGHLKGTVSKRLSSSFKLNMGSEFFYKSYEQDVIKAQYIGTSVFKDKQFSGFLEGQLRLSDRFVSRVGGRLDYTQKRNRFLVSPRLSMVYITGSNSQLSAAYGQYYQEPESQYAMYNPQLDPARADQYMLNFQWSKKNRILRSEVFYKNYSQLVKFEKEEPLYSPDYFTNQGKGFAYGLDLFYRDKKTIRNGNYWLSYSYLVTERDYKEFPYAAVPNYASKHNLSGIYKHWISKWRSMPGLAFKYSSPRFYNDPNQVVFNQAKMKGYSTLNFNWSYLHKENIIFYFSASNILGISQKFGYEFSNTPDSNGIYQKRPILPAAPRFFVLGCFITLSKSGTENQLDNLNNNL